MLPVLVTGVHAAGKSTVGRELADRTGTPFLEYADFMLPLLGTRDRSYILSIPFAKRAALYRGANSAITKHFASNNTHSVGLLTIHLSLYLDGQLETFGDEHYLTLNARGLLLVECEPSVILERRRADTQRFRHLDTIEEISYQQEQNRKIAQHVSELCGATTHTFDNSGPRVRLNDTAAWLSRMR